MKTGPGNAAGIQDADGKDEEHIGSCEIKHIEKQVYKPEKNGRVQLPGFVETVRDTFEQLSTDIDDQNSQERTVQPDGKTGPEKIVPHDDNQDQYTGYRKAVVHGKRYLSKL